MRKVCQERHEHPGSSETEERRSNDWRDPSGLVSRPGEPEQADWEHEGPEHGWRDPSLRLEVAFGLDKLLFKVQLVPHAVEGITDKTADKQSQERQVAVSRKEAVSFEVHSREGLEVRVKNSIDQPDVDVDGQNDRLGKRHGEWPQQSGFDEFTASHFCAIDLALGFELVVSSEFSESLSSPVEDILRGGLGHGERQQGQTESTQPEHLIERPPPSLGGDSVTRDHRGESGTGGSGETVKAHGVGEFVWSKAVLEGCTTCSKRGRTDESSKESQNAETGKVGDSRSRGLQRAKDCQGDNVRDTPSDLGDLGDGTEEEWADTVTDDKEREGQSRGDCADLEDLAELHDGGRHDGRAHVDGNGDEHDAESRPALLARRPILGVLEIIIPIPTHYDSSILLDITRLFFLLLTLLSALTSLFCLPLFLSLGTTALEPRFGFLLPIEIIARPRISARDLPNDSLVTRSPLYPFSCGFVVSRIAIAITVQLVGAESSLAGLLLLVGVARLVFVWNDKAVAFFWVTEHSAARCSIDDLADGRLLENVRHLDD